MLINELKNRPSLVLSEDTNKRYRLYTSTETEVKWLESLLIIHPENEYFKDITIEMIAHISEVKPMHVSNVIKKIKDHKVRDSKDVEFFPEYTCYQEHKSESKNNNVIKHEEKLSSFHCACELLQCKWFIVIEEKIENILIFQLDKNREQLSGSGQYNIGIDGDS